MGLELSNVRVLFYTSKEISSNDMQQPYESNPECNYQAQVPLEKKERQLILFWKIVLIIPLAMLSLLLFGLLMSYYINDGFRNFEGNMLLLPVALMIFFMSIYHIFKKEKYKEIFESEVDNQFGIVFLNWIYLKDKVGNVSPFPFFYKTNRVKIGKRYRIHKLSNKDLLLKIEDIS
ncbi:MAG: hypothetical protein ABH826_05420 [Patescibacteria group bacterium]